MQREYIYSILKIHLSALIFLTLWRLFFLIYFSDLNLIQNYKYDILNIFFLGMRIDLTLLAYIQVPISIYMIFNIFMNKFCNKKLLTIYFFTTLSIYSFLLFANFGFYSYFGENINLLFFGIIDDDKTAILKTIWDNYPVIYIIFIFFIYLYILFNYLKRTFNIIKI
jgi:hypothetical protein